MDIVTAVADLKVEIFHRAIIAILFARYNDMKLAICGAV
mgnify:CR=1 FL=1